MPGKLAEIHDYCRCDVLDTYFVFLRTRVLLGRLTLDEEQGIIAERSPGLRPGPPSARLSDVSRSLGRLGRSLEAGTEVAVERATITGLGVCSEPRRSNPPLTRQSCVEK